MAFSWKECTVVHNRLKSISAECFKGIGTYKYCLTPNIKKGLEVWLSNKMHRYGASKFTRESVEYDIAELLRKCCDVDKVTLLMKRDVANAEIYIIPHIKNAVDTCKFKGIYSENLPEETYEDYKQRKIVTQEDVEEYMRGIIQL